MTSPSTNPRRQAGAEALAGEPHRKRGWLWLVGLLALLLIGGAIFLLARNKGDDGDKEGVDVTNEAGGDGDSTCSGDDGGGRDNSEDTDSTGTTVEDGSATTSGGSSTTVAAGSTTAPAGPATSAPAGGADGDLNSEGTACRSTDVHGRIILDVNWVPQPGSQAGVAVDSFVQIAPHCAGAQGVIYDTALRGVHHQTLLRDLGWLSVNKVAAAKADTRGKARRKDGTRVEKSTHVEDRVITDADGVEHTISLFAQGGAIGISILTDTGERTFSNSPESGLTATPTRAATAGTTSTGSPRPPAAKRSWSGSTAPTTTPSAGSIAPRTSARSPKPTPTSRPCIGDATTPSPSTGPSMTRSGFGGRTRSATNASTSTCSPTPSS